MQRSDNDNEQQRLGAISIAQQFSWTGISDEKNAVAAATDGFSLEGLVLWNVLGFALDESTYLRLALVSKEWNRMVRALEPPVMMQISRLLQGSSRDLPFDKHDEHVNVLKNALRMLCRRDSSLYRKEEDDGTKQWPSVQPQFGVLLMRFVFALCIGENNSNNKTAHVYETTTAFLETVAQDVIDNLWNQGNDDSEDPIQVLEFLVDQWTTWEGIRTTVHDICGYVNQHYVPHHSLPTIQESGQQGMARCLVKVTTLDDAAMRIQRILELLRQVQVVVTTTESEAMVQHGPLFLRVYQICQMISNMSLPNNGAFASVAKAYHDLKVRLVPFLVQAKKEEEQERARISGEKASADLPVKIVTADGHTFSFHLESSFLESSGFLRRLHLRPGDKIKLSVKSADMEQAKLFYELDEISTFPEVQSPLRSNRLVELVGEAFSEFVESMTDETLMELINFANIMDFKSLLVLCSMQMAILISRNSPEERQAIFNLLQPH